MFWVKLISDSRSQERQSTVLGEFSGEKTELFSLVDPEPPGVTCENLFSSVAKRTADSNIGSDDDVPRKQSCEKDLI